MSQILRGLIYLHDRRILHRDVRLRQIIFVSNDPGDTRVKLSDFWCAVRMSRFSKKVIDASRPIDSTVTAPEVLEKGLWTVKADIWGAGCVAFEMLHGCPPFGGEGAA